MNWSPWQGKWLSSSMNGSICATHWKARNEGGTGAKSRSFNQKSCKIANRYKWEIASSRKPSKGSQRKSGSGLTIHNKTLYRNCKSNWRQWVVNGTSFVRSTSGTRSSFGNKRNSTNGFWCVQPLRTPSSRGKRTSAATKRVIRQLGITYATSLTSRTISSWGPRFRTVCWRLSAAAQGNCWRSQM